MPTERLNCKSVKWIQLLAIHDYGHVHFQLTNDKLNLITIGVALLLLLYWHKAQLLEIDSQSLEMSCAMSSTKRPVDTTVRNIRVMSTSVMPTVGIARQLVSIQYFYTRHILALKLCLSFCIRLLTAYNRNFGKGKLGLHTNPIWSSHNPICLHYLTNACSHFLSDSFSWKYR